MLPFLFVNCVSVTKNVDRFSWIRCHYFDLKKGGAVNAHFFRNNLLWWSMCEKFIPHVFVCLLLATVVAWQHELLNSNWSVVYFGSIRSGVKVGVTIVTEISCLSVWSVFWLLWLVAASVHFNSTRLNGTVQLCYQCKWVRIIFCKIFRSLTVFLMTSTSLKPKHTKNFIWKTPSKV